MNIDENESYITYICTLGGEAMEPQMTKWSLSAEDIKSGSASLMDQTRAMYDSVATIPDNKVVTFS